MYSGAVIILAMRGATHELRFHMSSERAGRHFVFLQGLETTSVIPHIARDSFAMTLLTFRSPGRRPTDEMIS